MDEIVPRTMALGTFSNNDDTNDNYLLLLLLLLRNTPKADMSLKSRSCIHKPLISILNKYAVRSDVAR